MKKFLLIVKEKETGKREVISMLGVCLEGTKIRFERFNKNFEVVSIMQTPIFESYAMLN